MAYYLNSYVYFSLVTGDPDSSGDRAAADALPTWAVYENGAGSAVASGTMEALSGETGVYVETGLQILTASGFEEGKCYLIVIEAAVNSHAGAWTLWFYVDYPTADFYANTIDRLNGFFNVADPSFTLTELAGASSMNAAGIRAAVGLAIANLDTQLAGPLSANVTQWKGATAPAMTGDAYSKVSSLTYNGSLVLIDLKKINGTTMNGNGTTVPFGP